MDSKIIKQYGEEILCYRLRTARQKKRMQYKDLDKKLIRLYKEERHLWKLQGDPWWEPLVPPVQKGWIRYFVLREDTARSRQADFFESILKKINTYQYDWKKDFKKKKRKRGRKIYVVKHQELLRPYEHYFKRLAFTKDEEQFFSQVYEKNQKGELSKRYVFKEPWRFVLKVKPNMIDKIRKIDSVTEARIKEIDNYMIQNQYRGRQTNLLCGHDRYNWRRYAINYRENYQYKFKSLIQVLDLERQD